ncbi:MAG: TIM44-like domain-containing protein [Rhizomicrobium sp.]
MRRVVTAFARGDRTTLKPLLSDEVFAAFAGVIAGREQRKETVDFTFISFKDVKIVHAALKNRAAEITVAIGAQSSRRPWTPTARRSKATPNRCATSPMCGASRAT